MITVYVYQSQFFRDKKMYGNIVGVAKTYQDFCNLVEEPELAGKFFGYQDQSGKSLTYHEAKATFGYESSDE